MTTYPKIRICGDLSYGTGYNNALRGLVQSLKTLGVTSERVRVVGVVSSGGYDEIHHHDWFREYWHGPWAGDDQINIVHLSPTMVGDYHTQVGSRYNIAYCAWETDRLPQGAWKSNGVERSVVKDLNRFDEIWVPTEFLVGVFQGSGVTSPIYVIPHALQEELLARPVPPTPGGRVVFYTVGSWSPRKNVEGLLRAWFQTGWTPATPVQLLLHCVPPTRDIEALEAASWNTNEAAKNLYEAAPNKTEVPSFGVLTVPRSYAQILDFHAAGSVFLSASRGEGFCLPAVEAVAMGRLVIAAGPALDGVHGVHHLPWTKQPIVPMPDARGYELDHEWWEPNAKALMEAMQEAYAHAKEGLQDPGTVEWVRQTYSPKTIGSLLLPRLEHAADVLSKSGW